MCTFYLCFLLLNLLINLSSTSLNLDFSRFLWYNKKLKWKEDYKMKLNKKMEHDYQTYLVQFSSQTTIEEYKHLIRKCNPNALSDSLTHYLKRFFFDIVEVSVSEDKLKVVVKDRGDVELGIITSHYADFPMLYSVSTHDAVKLLSHIWYSYEDGFDLARMSGYWEFPELFDGGRVLKSDTSFPYVHNYCLRTKIKEVFIANKGAGKGVYLAKLQHLHDLSKVLEALCFSTYQELPTSAWVSSLEVEPYTSSSVINTQVCVRPFVEVEVV